MKRTRFSIFTSCVAIAVLAVVFGGCQEPPGVMQIGEVDVSREEFDRAFETSPYIYDQAQGREEFLDRFVTKKLILLEAERLGMDHDEELLFDLQIFWEQALMKRVLRAKNQEFLKGIEVSDDAIAAYYAAQKSENFAEKPLVDVRDQIRQILMKEEQRRRIQQWIVHLRQQTIIHIDNEALDIGRE